MKYGRTVKPQKDQSSNLSLADEQVMQKRNAPITSFAFPLGAGHDGAGEQSGAKR